ncbi:MAG: tryptophan--tRNA ligase [Verrucomicrobiota bacterium]
MRVLSGIQPSGILHIGNYFGMMQPSVELQHQHSCYYFIADYHALTSLQDAEALRQNVKEAVIDFIACGLDIEKTVLFRQSAIPEVHELAWYLSTLTPMGLLERCTSYKDKLAKGITPSHGLFAYPVLMAADILLYQAELVPVGKDQKQHLEVARDLAQKFNDTYGEVFKIPEPQIRKETAVLPGTDGQKMSKSYNNTVEIFAEEKTFRKRIMSIKTDSTPVEDPKPIEDSILLEIADAVGNGNAIDEMRAAMEKGGVGYGDLKKQLFQLLWTYFEPMREKRQEIVKEDGYWLEVLEKGEIRARETAKTTLEQVRQAVGIR